MEFPLSKREMQILKEIETKFNANPNKLYIVNNPEEFAVHREIMALLEQRGFVKEQSVRVQGENYAMMRKHSYTLLTNFSEVNSWIEDKNTKAKNIKGNQFNIGSITANGSNFILGDTINSTLSIDNSTSRIEQEIEEKGGEEKEELRELLEEVKELIENMQDSRHIPKNKGLFSNLSNHLEKHGWFYGEVVSLLGSAIMQMLLK